MNKTQELIQQKLALEIEKNAIRNALKDILGV